MVVLAMVASVEAIFISTFVMISQNRMAEADDKRADLNLQISLLAEHETTQLLSIVTAIAEKLGLDLAQKQEIAELQEDVTPDRSKLARENVSVFEITASSRCCATISSDRERVFAASARRQKNVGENWFALVLRKDTSSHDFKAHRPNIICKLPDELGFFSFGFI